MKKSLLPFLSLFFLLTAFTCENEPLEGYDDVVGNTSTETSLDCLAATQAYIAAISGFSNWDGVDNSQYTILCNAYASSLQGMIDNCGDPTGSLQALLGTLGDCSEPLDPDSCEGVTAAVGVAQNNFNNAPDDQYTQFCNVYVMALESQIEACGDADGSIQDVIDGLGDCQQNTPTIEISLTAGTLSIDFDLVDVVEDGTTLKVTGQTSASNPFMVYFEVEEGATGTDIINSEFVLTLSTTDPDYFPNTDGFDDFTSTINENSPSTLIGTFGGIVTNSGGADLNVSQGVISIMY